MLQSFIQQMMKWALQWFQEFSFIFKLSLATVEFAIADILFKMLTQQNWNHSYARNTCDSFWLEFHSSKNSISSPLIWFNVSIYFISSNDFQTQHDIIRNFISFLVFVFAHRCSKRQQQQRLEYELSAASHKNARWRNKKVKKWIYKTDASISAIRSISA